MFQLFLLLLSPFFLLILLLINPLTISSILDGQTVVQRDAENVFLKLTTKEAAADEITEPLPGLNFKPNFKHFSGFLQVSATHFLHYWLVTSQGSPAEDSLVFWLQGGPACSSINGLLNELGPYLVESDGRTLAKNPHSWNRHASIVFLESPAGTGFSYATDGNTTTNDDLTALENYEAIKQFLARFPAFRHRPLFITGESYAGVFVPTLAASIVDGMADFAINLTGIAIGNGLVNIPMNRDTLVRFAYGHGILDESSWRYMERRCCGGCIDTCDLSPSAQTGTCKQMVDDLYQFFWRGGLNRYDIYRECDTNPSRNSLRAQILQRGLLPTHLLPWEDTSSSNLSADNSSQLNEPSDGISAPLWPCLNDTDITMYMNLPQLRKALHIPANLGQWETCNVVIHKHGYQWQTDDTAPIFKHIFKRAPAMRALLYYGDTDAVCNFMLGQRFSAGLGLGLTQPKTAWKFGGQVGGFKTIYAGGRLTFLTVRGTGHMAPQWRAPQMEHVISQFLRNRQI